MAHRGPQRGLMGILAAILRFVPYIGALISAVFPLALAAAVDPGWTTLLWTAALFLAVEPIVGHVIEPMLYGHTTGCRRSPWCSPRRSGPRYGTDRTGTRNASDDMSGRARAPRRAAPISRRHVRRSPRALAA